MEEAKQGLKLIKSYEAPKCLRIFFDFLIEELNDGPEYGIRITIVVECFRALFYYGLIFTLLLGYILTTLFVTKDHAAIIQDVFGAPNICTYMDFPPATYVLPFVYVLPMLAGMTYSIVSIFRISIAHKERKISRLTKILLWIAHVHFILSLIWLTIIFAVNPNRENPETMIVHTLPYINLKIAFCTLQVSVVYFGTNVAWKEMDFSPCCKKKWFVLFCWIHAILQFITMVVSNIMILNALGDMGESGLLGKGLRWNVHDPTSKAITDAFANRAAFVLNFIIPLLQSQYLFTKGFRDISKTHTISFYISDNQKALYNNDCHHIS